MKKPKKFPFAERTTVTQVEAVKFIVETVYPQALSTEELRSTKDKVQQRIKYYFDKGVFTRWCEGERYMLNTKKFFEWAADVKSWETLQKIEGMPLKPKAGDTGKGMIGITGEGFDIIVPSDGEIKNAYTKLAAILILAK